MSNQGYNQEDLGSALLRQLHFWLLLLAGLADRIEADHWIPASSPAVHMLSGIKYLLFVVSYLMAASWTPKRRPYSAEERAALGMAPTAAQQLATATTTAVITAAAVAAATAAAPPAAPAVVAPPIETPTANMVAAAVTAAVAAAVAAPAPAAPVAPPTDPLEVIVEEPKP